MVMLSRMELRGAGSSRFLAGRVDDVAVKDYRRARDRFLEGLLAEGEGRIEEAVDAWVESAGLSLHFTSAYAHCLSRAAMLLGTEPGAASALLRRLVEARPEVPVAARMLERLGGEVSGNGEDDVERGAR